MLSDVLVVAWGIVLVCLWCVALVAPLALLWWWEPWRHPYRPSHVKGRGARWRRASYLLVVPALVWTLLVLAFGIVQLDRSLERDTEHRWDGGSGPATVCTYETVTRMAGKVPTRVTQTVCRDPR